MSAIVADLHVHTTRSDGTIHPEDIPRLALDHDLVAIAVTDHDRMPPWDRPVSVREGVICIAAIELRVESHDAGRVDLLGYGLSQTDELAAEIERLQRDRQERAQQMGMLLAEELDIDLDVDYGVGVGRPHIAKAVANATELNEQAVFDRYIGDNGPCYVARQVPSFETGAELLKTACAFVVLAHPLRYDDVNAALALVDGLDGVEVAYPYGASVDRSILDEFLSTRQVIQTGGSDAHDEVSIASAGLDHDDFEPVARRLGITVD